jgi:hypothetical protein
MKKIIVVDMDDTIAIPRKFSYYLWTVARFIFNLGRRLQKRNDVLCEKLSAYDRIIVLTARPEKLKEVTMSQLRKFSINPEKVIFCPVNEVVYRWKKEVIEQIEKDNSCEVDWIDDLKDKYEGPEY